MEGRLVGISRIGVARIGARSAGRVYFIVDREPDHRRCSDFRGVSVVVGAGHWISRCEFNLERYSSVPFDPSSLRRLFPRRNRYRECHLLCDARRLERVPYATLARFHAMEESLTMKASRKE